MLTDIIQKRHRTKEDLDYFRKLYLNEYNIDYSDDKINKILDSLKYLSKSRLNTIDFCPFQYKLANLLHIDDYSAKIEKHIKLGKLSHFAFEKVYDYLNIDEMINLDDIDLEKYIYKTLLRITPERIMNKWVNLDQFYKNFSNYEANRFILIRDDLHDKNEVKKYFFPLYREVFIYNDKYRIRGIIDAIFLNKDNSVRIVDYKTGKMKDFDNSFVIKTILKEMSFYKLLYEDIESYIVKDDGLYLYEKLRVDSLHMLFIKDMYNSRVFKYDKLMSEFGMDFKYEIKIAIKDYWDRINNNRFEMRYFRDRKVCMKYCPYFFNFCYKINDRYKDIIELDEKFLGGKNNELYN